MEMKDGLSGNPPVVGKNVESLKRQSTHDGPGNNLCNVKYIVQVVFGNGEEVRTMLLGDDERMTMMDRVDVEDGDDAVVFIQYFCRELARNNLAECAV